MRFFMGLLLLWRKLFLESQAAIIRPEASTQPLGAE